MHFPRPYYHRLCPQDDAWDAGNWSLAGQGREGGWTPAVAEGFETADAFTRMNTISCWASLGARRLNQFVIPYAVAQLLIAEDTLSSTATLAR